jgi:adenylate cyclase
VALIADGYRRHGQAERARERVDEALAAAGRTGERVYEAELHRLAGELIGQEPCVSRTSAEDRFLAAIHIARQQGALSLELRAATSLARSWGARGRVADARTLLGDVYGRFTEGFDTPDLRDARRGLDALAS